MDTKNLRLPLDHIPLPSRAISVLQTEQPQDMFESQVGPVLRRAIEASGWSFTCGDGTQEFELSAEEVAAADGLLSVVVDRARQMAVQALGWKVDMSLVDDPKSLSECTPAPAQTGLSPAMWVMMCHAQLEDLVRNQPKQNYDAGLPVSLTSWYSDFMRRKPGMDIRPRPVKTLADPAQRQGT